MDFFQSQDSLTSIQWVLRAVTAYVFMFIVAKAMGQRSISQLRLLDFVIALMIGNIIAHPLSDEQLGLKGSIITMSVLVIMYSASVIAGLKFNKIRRFIDPPPISLIEKGKINYQNMKKAKLSLDDLLSEARKKQIEDITKIALAIWEPDGTISFFLHPQNQSVTKADIHLNTQRFTSPRTIIKEGKIDFKELAETGKDEQWIKQTLQSVHHASINDILLGTINENGRFHIFFYK